MLNPYADWTLDDWLENDLGNHPEAVSYTVARMIDQAVLDTADVRERSSALADLTTHILNLAVNRLVANLRLEPEEILRALGEEID